MQREPRSSRRRPGAPGSSPPGGAGAAPAHSGSGFLALQRAAGNRAVGRLLGAEGGPPAQTDTRSSPQPDGSPAAEPAAPRQEGASPEPESSQAVSAPAVVVEDDAETLTTGQMRKSDFLARLRVEVMAAAAAGSGGAESAAGGAALDPWLDRLAQRDAASLDRDLRRLADGEGPRPATAEDLLAAVAARVRTGVETWARTGEAPADFPPPELAAGGLGGGLLGGVLFKANVGGPRDPGDPEALRTRLGAGRPLDGTLRARMESAFGRRFGHVRVHDDSGAASVAAGLNAKAFTVGEHVAFASREYRPGTLAGDALIAHELAHVAQQEGAAGPGAAGGGYEALERNADLSAASVVASIWGGLKSRVRTPLPAAGQVRGPIRLQRCEGCRCCGRGAADRPRSQEVPDLPADVVQQIRPSIQSAGARPRALEALEDWARCDASLGIDWDRVKAIRYGEPTEGACVDTQEGQRSVQELGSCTDASDPQHVTVWIGAVAFSSVANLYSTFRHELVHVEQHRDPVRATSRGIGIKEVEAYLWELDHAEGSGLARPENWGLNPDGTADTYVGLSRVVDGLLRAILRLENEVHANPALIPASELAALRTRVACALLTLPDPVMRAFPSIAREELQPACNAPGGRSGG